MPDRYADYYYVRVSARAVIGEASAPVSRFSVTYELDEIPRATLDLAIGRDTKFPARISEGQGILTKILPFTPIKIFMTAKAEPGGRAAPQGKDPGFGSGEMLVFEGFVSGPSMNKSAGGVASLTLSCFGMPGALSGASRAATGVTIARAINGSEIAVTRLGNTGLVKNVYEEILSDPNSITPVEKALWDHGILPLFSALVDSTDAWTNEGNEFGEQALDRINSGEGDLPEPELALSQFAGTGTNLQQRLARHLVQELFDIWGAASAGSDFSLWDALMEYTKGFFFHFVPAIDADAVAPVTFNLGGEPYRILDPSEYSVVAGAASMSPEFYAYITSVGLLTDWNALADWQDLSARASVLGRAVLPNLDKNSQGRFLPIPAPIWLLPLATPGQNTLLPGEGIPDAGSLSSIGKVPKEAPSKTEEKVVTSGAGDAYAEAALHEVVFLHRGLEISGRLRLDIAPGSLIRMNTPGERFSGGGDVLFGCVKRVTIEVGNSGQDSYARTSFMLMGVRSEAEHERHTVEEHPLFDEEWRGARLLKY